MRSWYFLGLFGPEGPVELETSGPLTSDPVDTKMTTVKRDHCVPYTKVPGTLCSLGQQLWFSLWRSNSILSVFKMTEWKWLNERKKEFSGTVDHESLVLPVLPILPHSPPYPSHTPHNPTSSVSERQSLVGGHLSKYRRDSWPVTHNSFPLSHWVKD